MRNRFSLLQILLRILVGEYISGHVYVQDHSHDRSRLPLNFPKACKLCLQTFCLFAGQFCTFFLTQVLSVRRLLITPGFFQLPQVFLQQPILPPWILS